MNYEEHGDKIFGILNTILPIKQINRVFTNFIYYGNKLYLNNFEKSEHKVEES